jgi:hypothetical protein
MMTMRALRPLQAVAVTYRIAFGPRDGQLWRSLTGWSGSGPPGDEGLLPAGSP